MTRTIPLLPLFLLLAACTPTASPTGTPSPSSAPAVSAPSSSPGLSASPAAAPVAAPSLVASGPSVVPAASREPVGSASIQVESVGSWQDFDRGGGNNVVVVENSTDGRFRARGNAELDRIRGDDVSSANVAEAHASCTDCQTIAAAVQVVVYRRGASTIAPVNRAVATNQNCTRCVTIARALQYVIPVDDLDDIPPEVNRLVRRVNSEATYFEHIKDLDKADPKEAQARLNQLEADFSTLQQYLRDMMDQQEDTSSPTPSAVASPSPDATPQATVGPAATAVSPSTPGPSRTAATVVPASSPGVPAN